MEITTLTGYSLEDVSRILAHPLPPQCYKKAQGTRWTDIDSTARIVVFTKLFGPATLGWAIQAAGNVVYETFIHPTSEKTWGRCLIPEFTLRIQWLFDGVPGWGAPITIPAGWELDDPKYVGKAAATYGFSGASSFMGFQTLVYMGELDERKAQALYKKVGPHPFEADILRGLAMKAEPEQEGPQDKQLKMPPKETTCPGAEKALALRIPDKGIQLSDVAQDRPALRELMGHSNKYVQDAATFLYRESSWLTDELLEVLTEGLDKKTILPRLNMYEALQGHSVGCAHPKDTSLENEAAWRKYFE
jgi:hypothetical protein